MNTDIYINLRTNEATSDISLLFPDWQGTNEKVMVFGAHDDDPLIGAGYMMSTAMANGAEIFVVIFCKGDCGYSDISQKEEIVAIRREENERALIKFGIKPQNILRLEYPDFSLSSYVGYHINHSSTGTFTEIIELVRKNKITRALIPNGYKEHPDHTAAYDITAFDLVQAGDAVVVDYGVPQKVKSIIQYSVWADFSPEDAAVAGEKDMAIRANLAVAVPKTVENKVIDAIKEYSSQQEIIENLVKMREERKVKDRYIELYTRVDTRPKLNYNPYKQRIEPLI